MIDKFIFILFLCTLASSDSGPLSFYRTDEYGPEMRSSLPFDDGRGNITIMDLKDRRLLATARLKDLSYYLYTMRNLYDPVKIEKNSLDDLTNSGYYTPHKQTVIIIHGWLNDHDSLINELIRNAILKIYDVNVLVADWGTLAFKNYFSAKSAVQKIGTFIGDFINDIVAHQKNSYKDFTLIGHSLGAHVCGAAGSRTKEKIDQIIGLDPALPLFSMDDIRSRLDPTDADFVHVIHTSGGVVGFKSPIGHADYYPNGGSSQPGCLLDIGRSCAHSRSYEFYADSIENDLQQFFATRCDSFKDFQKGICDSLTNLSIMGRFLADKSARGSYYLTTNPEKPFAKDSILDII